MRELFVADGRTEVGEQAQVLAQSQDRLLGTELALQLVVLPVADGAEQHGVGLLGELQRGLGQRMAVAVVRDAADIGYFQLELQVEDLEDLDGLIDDLRADAVAGEDCDFHWGSFRGKPNNRTQRAQRLRRRRKRTSKKTFN